MHREILFLWCDFFLSKQARYTIRFKDEFKHMMQSQTLLSPISQDKLKCTDKRLVLMYTSYFLKLHVYNLEHHVFVGYKVLSCKSSTQTTQQVVSPVVTHRHIC